MSDMAAQHIHDHLVFGEYGGVNPSITDSSTFTFLSPHTMQAMFEGDAEGCFLYARHLSPSTKALADGLARLEGSEAALVTASGMAAISATLLQLCDAGDEIVSSRTVYGGTYALLKYFLPRFGIRTTFVDIRDPAAVRAALTPRTRVLYLEAISNPLLEVADLPALRAIADDADMRLVVDNTFSPLLIRPLDHGADIVIHSLTKYINGMSDGVGGAICADQPFIDALMDVHSGASMLLGPVLDSWRAASMLKNLQTLHLRMRQHSANAQFLAEQLAERGVPVHYPGLPHHPQHALLDALREPAYGYGGMLTLDVGTQDAANALMTELQRAQVGYLAVSLGYVKTLFSAPGSSTSSEIPPQEQASMGLSPGLIRFSVGLDPDIELTWDRFEACLDTVGIETDAPVVV